MTITIKTQNSQVLLSCQVSEEQSIEWGKRKQNPKETGQNRRDSFTTEKVKLKEEKMGMYPTEVETKRKSEDRLKD